MKVNNTLKLLTIAALTTAAVAAHAEDWRGRGDNNRATRAPAVAQPAFRHAPVATTHRAQPVWTERARYEQRGRFERPVYAPAPVVVQRPVVVTRPVYGQRPVYAPAPVYHPQPVVYPHHAPAYYPDRDGGTNVQGAIGGAVLGGVIGSAVGQGEARGVTTAIGAIIGGLIGSGL